MSFSKLCAKQITIAKMEKNDFLTKMFPLENSIKLYVFESSNLSLFNDNKNLFPQTTTGWNSKLCRKITSNCF